MTPRLGAIAASICAAVFAFAFAAAPKSCEWGLTAYFWVGVASMIMLFALPLMLVKQAALGRRLLLSLAFAAGSISVWFAGLFAANIQIMCRLF